MKIPSYLISRESEIAPLSEQELSHIYEFRRRVESYYNAMQGEFKHEVRQFEKSYDNQQAEQISLMV